MTAPFTVKKIGGLPGALAPGALTQQLNILAEQQRALASSAPPPDAAYEKAGEIQRDFMPTPKVVTQQPKVQTTPAEPAPQRLPDLGFGGLTRGGGILGALNALTDLGTYAEGSDESEEAQAERIEAAKEHKKTIDAIAMRNAELRAMPDAQRQELGMPSFPAGRDPVVLGQAMLDDLKLQAEANKAVAEAEKTAPKQTWWLNAAQTAAKSAAKTGTSVPRAGSILWEMARDAIGLDALTGGGTSTTQGWVNAVDKSIDAMLPGDKVQSKDFLTALSQGAGSFAGFMVGGYAAAAAGIPSKVGVGLLGAANEGSAMFQEAEQFNATSTQKYIAFILGAGLGVSEAVPIDRMFMRADASTGGLVRRMLTNTSATSLEEFMQEFGQAIGEDMIAKFGAGFDPDREIDAREWVKAGLVGGITGAAGGSVSTMLTEQGVSTNPIPVDEQQRLVDEAISTIQRQVDVLDGMADVQDNDAPEGGLDGGMEIAEAVVAPEAPTQTLSIAEFEAAGGVTANPNVRSVIAYNGEEFVADTHADALKEAIAAHPEFEQKFENDPNQYIFYEVTPQVEAKTGEPTTFRGGTIPTRESDGKLELTHWSRSPRATLDPAQMATGPLRGQERERLRGPDAVPRTYYGVNARTSQPPDELKAMKKELAKAERLKTGKFEAQEEIYRRYQQRAGYIREGGLGNIRHTVAVDPDTIYNWNEDPLDLNSRVDRTLSGPEQVTQKERLIRDAGFAGYFMDQSRLGQTVALFDSATPERITDERTGEELSAPDDDVEAKRDAKPPKPRTLEEEQRELINTIPGLKGVLKYLTPEERARVRKRNAARLVELFESMPDAKEMAAVAISGRAKRGWYANSARALVEIFGVQDAPRFTALLAALSPQTSVESNTINALQTWTNWVAAGRPQDRKTILKIMGKSVEGGGTEASVLDAWKNNSIRALTAPDPTSIVLSGPKVDSFMRNLWGVTNEVTNDAWMANYANIDQSVLGGQTLTERDEQGTVKVKSPGYLAMSAAVRAAAESASRLTGETWTASEVQETVWSWAKTLYERAVGGQTALDILNAGGLTNEDIAATPDFATLFTTGVYRNILEKGGYDVQALASGGRPDGGDGPRGPVSIPEGAKVDAEAFERHLRRAARRLDELRKRRDREAAEAEQRKTGRSVETLDEDGIPQSTGEFVSGGIPFFDELIEDIDIPFFDDYEATVVSDKDLSRLPGLPKESTGPIESVVRAARAYAETIGIPVRRQAEYVKADPDRGRRIAEAYAAMEDNPSDPAVAAAYQAMIAETLAQYQFVKASGIKVEAIEPGQPDPYPEGPKQVLADLQNGHLWFFPTDQGFGTVNEALAANPLLAPTNEFIGDRQLLANDVFRIVHDFFGHGIEGSGFGARGEENAWQSHMRLYTEAALPAVTSETRGQNSWVNFGPFGEQNRANQRETVYADQKTGIMPSWTWTEGVADDAGFEAQRARVVRDSGLPLFPKRKDQSFDRWFGNSKAVKKNGQPMVLFHGTPTKDGFRVFDPDKKGKTSVLFSVIDQHRQGFFFSENEAFAKTFAEQGRVPGQVLPVMLSVQKPFDAREYTKETRLQFEKIAERINAIDPAYDTRFVRDRIGADNFWETLDTDEGGDVFVQAMRDLGYDGVILYEPNHDDRSTETTWMVFDNTQIKSAVENTGGYSRTNPDIYAARDPGQREQGTAANRAVYEAEQTRPEAGIPTTPQNEDLGTDANLAKISKNFINALNLTARQGRFTLKGSDVMGQFTRSSRVIRLRTWNDLSSLVHEGGHALNDSMAGPLKAFVSAHEAELMKAADDLYGADTNTLSRAQHAREGFAEFFRVYTLNRAYAVANYPQMTDDFQKLLEAENPTVEKALSAVGAQFAAYLQAPSAQVIRNMVVSGKQPVGFDRVISELREAGFKTWFNEFARNTLQATANRYASLNALVAEMLNLGQQNTGQSVDLKAAKDPRILARMAPNFGPRAFVQMIDGIMPYNSVEPATASLRDALLISQGVDPQTTPRKIDQKRLDDFGAYLVGMRALDEYRRWGEGKIERPPIGATLGDVEQAVKELTDEYGESFTRAGQIVHEVGMAMWTKQFDAGLMDKETYRDGLDRQFYAPLQRDMSDKQNELGPGVLTGARSLVKRFKGSDRQIIHPLDALMHKLFSLERAIAENEVKKTLAQLADRVGAAGALVERIPANRMMGQTFSVKEIARALTKDDTLTAMDAQDLLTILSGSIKQENTISLFRSKEATEAGENILFYFENGKLSAIQVKDGSVGADVVNMINGIGRENMGFGMELIAGTSQIYRTAITTWPDFLIVNFIRDQMSTWVLNNVGFKPFATGLVGMWDEARQRKWARMYNASMGIMGGMNVAALHRARMERDIDSLRNKGYVHQAFGDPGFYGFIKGWGRLMELSETGTRVGLYRKAFERGKADGLNDWEASVEAGYIATDNMDFGLHGNRMLFARRTIPFLNAQIQGFYKMMRTLGGDEVAQRKGLKFVLGAYFKQTKGLDLSRREKDAINRGRLAWIKMASLGLLSALLHFIFEDDEDYQEVGEYMRVTNWVIPVGEGRIITIPKPFELAMIANAVERGLESASGDPTAKEKFIRGAALSLMPPMGPPAIVSAVEVAANYDFFSGQPIVPDYQAALDPALQYNNYTSSLAKELGPAIGVSPLVAEHIMSGLGASAYRDLMTIGNMADPNRPSMDETDAPVARRFVRDSRRGSQTSADFWGQASTLNGKLRRAETSYRAYVEQGNQLAANRYLNSLTADEKAYALLGTYFKAEAKRLNPFYRGRQIATIVSSMRREMLSELGLEDTDKFSDTGKIVLTAKTKAQVDETLAEIARREMRNTLVATGAPGWKNRKMMPVEPTVEMLREISPLAAEEFERRMTKAKVYDGQAVFDGWPEVRDRLIQDGEDAFLDDMIAGAKL